MGRTTFLRGKGVGDLKFGIAENELPADYKFELDPELSGESSENAKSFVSEEFGMRADFEGGRLSTIACQKSLVVKGLEIIDSDFKSIEGLIADFEQVRDNDEILIGDGVHHIIHVDQLGLSFWLDESETVKSVDCVAPWA
jgi:hypothetical protein